jgi:hypothetical protein
VLKKCEGDGDGGSRNPRGENIDRYTEDKTGKRERRRRRGESRESREREGEGGDEREVEMGC